jgi:hypothetical protein
MLGVIYINKYPIFSTQGTSTVAVISSYLSGILIGLKY